MIRKACRLGIISLFVLGLAACDKREHGPIYNYDAARDKKAILSFFDRNWYWLIAEASSDYSVEYMLDTQSSSQDPQHHGNMKIKVYCEDGKPLGFITYYKKTLMTGKILFLGVFEDARSKGIAKKLVTYAVNDFIKQGIKTVRLVTRVNNLAAQRVYLQTGFHEIHRDDTFVTFVFRAT